MQAAAVLTVHIKNTSVLSGQSLNELTSTMPKHLYPVFFQCVKDKVPNAVMRHFCLHKITEKKFTLKKIHNN